MGATAGDAGAGGALRIGEWTFDPRSLELVRGDVRERLPRRLGLLLERLAREPGAVVSREMLLRDVWGRVHADEDLLSRNVAALRRALGDDPREPRYVETIPKAGYRLIAAVESKPGGATAGAPPRRRILPAVLLAIGLGIALVGWWLGVTYRDAAVADGMLDRAQPLTSEPGWEIGPSLSGDGQLVAYAAAARGTTGARLIVRSVDGTMLREIDEPGTRNVGPVFVPGREAIVFRSYSPGRCELRLRELYGRSRRLADCAPGVASSIDVSGDGALVLYTAPALDAAHAPGLAIVAIADGTVTRVTSPTLDEGTDADARFAPGGRVTFARGDDSSQRLLVVPIAGGTPEPLWPVVSRLSGHAWTPSGDAIVIASDDPGYRALLWFDVRRNGASLLGGRDAQRPAFSASGDLVFELARFDSNIWAWDVDSGTVRSVAASTRYDGVPRLAPDGRRFAYVSTRADQESVWIASLDGAPEVRVPLDPGRRWTYPHFSPDGAFLLLTAWEGNRTALFEHEFATGRTVRLTEGRLDAFAGQYAGDDRTIVYARREGGTSKTLWRMDRESAPVQLAPAIDRFEVAGEDVVYSRRGHSGLRMLPVAGGEPREIDAPIDANNRHDWTVAGPALWYAALAADGQPALYRRELATGAVREMTRDVVPNATAATMAASPDGSFVLFARVDEVTIDLMRVANAAPPR